MKIKLHNSLTKQTEEFISIKKNQVSIYTCGPTVYYYPHIGNWSAYIYWDTLVRMLTINDYQVTRVMNITDVGHLTSDADEGKDKLEVRAEKEGKNAWEIAKFYTDNFLIGMKKLNLVMPKYIARATDFIPRQIDMIRTLKQKGYTYQTTDGVYFDTSKFKNYADFAKLDLKSLKAGARVDINKEKKNPTDFAVWKFSPDNKKRDMEWPTPNDILDSPSETVVMGFPGWHLECSAIAKNFLGDTLDIHTGGIDAIPVHHTNEIAQSESANGAKFVNYWLHNNFLKSNKKKISKSLGNGYTLENIEENGFSAMDFRLFILQGHYRTEGNFTFEGLTAAANRLKNWRNIAVIRHQIHSKYQEPSDSQKKDLGILTATKSIIEAVSHDLNTPEALRIIDDIFNRIADSELNDINRDSFIYLLEIIDNLLGIKLLETTPDISDDIKQLIIQRNIARSQQDWKKSDVIRHQLNGLGISIKDNKADSIWQYN